MEIVAEAVLSVSLELLFEKLSSSDVLKFARQVHLQTQLKVWEKKLLEISEVLNDAEEKQIAKKSVKEWLSELRDLAYDMEDVLDEFSYEAQRRKHLAESSTSTKVLKFIPTCCVPVQAIRNVKMGSKIKDINTRLEAIYDQKAELGLDKAAAIIQATWERPPTTSLVNESWVFGRDADKQKIMDMLLSDDGPIQTNFSVVPIVAMGGMGKTTLARLVYDDPETSNHFNLKAWVCVSDQFDVVRVTNTILKEVGNSMDSQDLNQIQDKLRKELKGKKILLVLDDIWNDKYDDWDCLRSPFWLVAPGSKILITTRNKNIAMMMRGDENVYELQNLSNDDCWLVFQKHAFENRNADEYPNLASIGREIVKKCGGLPLGARALGGLLRNERREDKWNIILSNPIWDLPGDQNCSILPALRLSYNVLPSPIKRCFGYSAIFPKDYEFDKEELVRLWMAEGFIQQSELNRQKMEMEDLGDSYFHELLSISFFQPSSSKNSYFVMHDLVNDLAKFVGREICFSLEENLGRNEQPFIFEKVRHSSFTRDQYDVFKKFEVFHGMKEHLRTFVALPITNWSERKYWHSHKVLEELIPMLKHLRVLSLSCYQTYEIPESIGHLKLLRYLNVSCTKVKSLPESIGNLYKLQTLILPYCRNLKRLPLSIRNLTSLRYLDITRTPLEEMPPQICELKSLQVLTAFLVGTGNNSNVKELRNISHLRGSLDISKLENVTNVEDARNASLDNKHKLENLRLSWSGLRNDDNQLCILESLQPHLGLNELRIDGYGGPKFPHWLEGVRFSKMVTIRLVNCKHCTSLPCLGQLPRLKNLEIAGMDGVKCVGKEFHGEFGSSFPQLEYLAFSDMPQWEVWESQASSLSESYPRLFHLFLAGCPKLIKELPTSLPSLVYFAVRVCPRLESPLGRCPSLAKLFLEICDEGVVRSGVDFRSLKQITIFGIVGLTRIQEGFVQLLSGLQVLSISNCEELKCLWEENGFDGTRQQGLLSKLQSLRIRGCRNIEKLPNGLRMLACLQELTIHDCPKLSSFPNSGFPPMLTSLVIQGCVGLTRLPDWIMVVRNGSDCSHACILEHLTIKSCPCLVCFPEGQLPSSLKELHITDCKNLKSLPGGVVMLHHDSTSDGGLHVLEVQYCSSLTVFPTGEFPATLKTLRIGDCEQLESISGKMFHSNNNSLEVLQITKYPSLKIIPECLYNLRELRIYQCGNLEQVPHAQLRNLRDLHIKDCKNVKLVPYKLQGLTALTTLAIENCENIRMPLSQWGLAMLTCLKKLTICGIFPQISSFSDGPTPPCLLPTTLTSLDIRALQNLKSLSSLSLQTLTSLEELYIYNCPKLESFCPKEGLPQALSQLYILNCPLLRDRCSKKNGQDWPNISHIPLVYIDGHEIFEQE